MLAGERRICLPLLIALPTVKRLAAQNGASPTQRHGADAHPPQQP